MFNHFRKFIQFSLWKNCTHNCLFCCNKGHKRISLKEKKQRLCKLIKYIETDSKFKFYNEVGVIGGELFDQEIYNSEVNNLFNQFLMKLAQLVVIGQIEKLYLATSLEYDISQNLIPILKQFNKLGILNKILICTSYDSKYRFLNKQTFMLWERNVNVIFKMMKKPIHIEIILTKDFLQKVNTGKINIVKFKHRYNAEVDFIEPSFIEFFGTKANTIIQLPDFLPARKDFLEFVITQCIKTKNINIENLLSIKLRPDTLVKFNDSNEIILELDRWKNNIRRTDSNGNVRLPGSYSDSELEMDQDLEMIKKVNNI